MELLGIAPRLQVNGTTLFVNTIRDAPGSIQGETASYVPRSGRSGKILSTMSREFTMGGGTSSFPSFFLLTNIRQTISKCSVCN